MAIFRETFKSHIIEELSDRKNKQPFQEILYPKVRVTSLVESSNSFTLNGLNVDRIKGFTLGASDIGGELSTLDALTNVNNKGTLIGITYTGENGTGVPVYTTPNFTKSNVNKKANLPSPGVTNVTISTQSKGGLVFKATVNFKFYGKEQYDVIYQTFMRPGNPVLIEYGHTMSSTTRESVKELQFFKNLTQEKILEFQNDLIQSKPMIKYKNGGAVTGLVSNFKISLNENNEYEAQIDLINSLEYLFTMPVEDTFLSYRTGEDESVNETIKTIFGHYIGEDYKPYLDSVLQTVLNDSVDNVSGPLAIPARYKESIISPDANQLQSVNLLRFSYEANPSPVGLTNPSRPENSDKYYAKANETLDFVYISLPYFFERLLPLILGNSSPRRHDYCSTERTDGLNLVSPSKLANLDITYGNIGGWETLRSVNLENLIINNKNLYDDATFRKQNESDFVGTENKTPPRFRNRLKDYRKKFGEAQGSQLYSEFWKFFAAYQEWESKETFPTNLLINREQQELILRAAAAGEPIPSGIRAIRKTTLEGFFVSYQKIRNSFLGASSVSEAIIKILNLVNGATSNIINLKMRVLETDQEGVQDQFVIHIFDENVLPRKDEVDVYTFFENDLSEAISYNFDFSLPSSVASTVIGNKFQQDEDEIVGDPQVYQIIKNGYLIDDEGRDVIFSMIEDFGTRIRTQNDLTRRCDQKQEKSKSDSEILEIFQTFLDGVESDSIRQHMLAYREYTPQAMKKEIITVSENNSISLFNTLPTSAKVSIKLQGIDGFRFGDMFAVRNMLPYPYDENNVFMLTGYKHDISSDGWVTTIDGIMIASTPPEKLPRGEQQSTPTEISTTTRSRTQLDPVLQEIVNEVKSILAQERSSNNEQGLDFTVISTVRDVEYNEEIGGAPNSRHLTGDAIDIRIYETTPGPVSSTNALLKPATRQSDDPLVSKSIEAHQRVANIFKEVATRRGIAIRWGGDFTSIYDPNHFDIPVVVVGGS